MDVDHNDVSCRQREIRVVVSESQYTRLFVNRYFFCEIGPGDSESKGPGLFANLGWLAEMCENTARPSSASQKPEDACEIVVNSRYTVVAGGSIMSNDRTSSQLRVQWKKCVSSF